MLLIYIPIKVGLGTNICTLRCLSSDSVIIGTGVGQPNLGILLYRFMFLFRSVYVCTCTHTYTFVFTGMGIRYRGARFWSKMLPWSALELQIAGGFMSESIIRFLRYVVQIRSNFKFDIII